MSRSETKPSFETGTGYLLSRLGSLANRSWTSMLADLNLTPHHHGVLLVLREHGPLGQQVLGRMIAVDSRNVVPILDGLVDNGLLHRRTDPHDRRRRTLSLTPTGKSVADKLADAAAGIETAFLAGLDEVDRAELNRILRQLLESLTS